MILCNKECDVIRRYVYLLQIYIFVVDSINIFFYNWKFLTILHTKNLIRY